MARADDEELWKGVPWEISLLEQNVGAFSVKWYELQENNAVSNTTPFLN